MAGALLLGSASFYVVFRHFSWRAVRFGNSIRCTGGPSPLESQSSSVFSDDGAVGVRLAELDQLTLLADRAYAIEIDGCDGVAFHRLFENGVVFTLRPDQNRVAGKLDGGLFADAIGGGDKGCVFGCAANDVRAPLFAAANLPIGGEDEQFGSVQGEAAGGLGEDDIGPDHEPEAGPNRRRH